MNKDKLKEIMESTGLGIDYEYIIKNLSDDSDFDDFMEQLNTCIYEYDIIGYYNAMQYLQENDYSLNNSIKIASELGYETSAINSELLATLLIQKDMMDDLSKVYDDLQEAFNE